MRSEITTSFPGPFLVLRILFLVILFWSMVYLQVVSHLHLPLLLSLNLIGLTVYQVLQSIYYFHLLYYKRFFFLSWLILVYTLICFQ